MTRRLKAQVCVMDREGDVTLFNDTAGMDTLSPEYAPHVPGLVLPIADCEDPPAAWIERAVPVLGLYSITPQHANGLILALFLHVIAAARAEAEAR